MRPHVEIIHEQDYIWHPAELIGASGTAAQRNLSYDEEDGSCSAIIEFRSDWSRPAGVHHAETEWFVLEGQVTIGDRVLGKGGYWMAPTGRWTPPVTAKEGTRILYFREYGDWGWDESPTDRIDVREDKPLVVDDSAAKEWIPVEIGSPMRFDLGGTPVPGLFIKMLYRDPKTGFYTRLIHAKPGWKEHPLAHHPVYEEAYTLSGGFEYNYGTMWEGTYFFRPALIRHGDFSSAEETGCTWLLRCDGDLVDWYTDEARVEMHGVAVNYGADRPGTLLPRLPTPVRSASVGAWENPHYQ